MRVEINAGGYRNYEPDWQTVRYERTRARTSSTGTSASRIRCSSPSAPVEMSHETAEETKAATGLFN
jgi:hypothetical protein